MRGVTLACMAVAVSSLCMGTFIGEWIASRNLNAVVMSTHRTIDTCMTQVAESREAVDFVREAVVIWHAAQRESPTDSAEEMNADG